MTNLRTVFQTIGGMSFIAILSLVLAVACQKEEPSSPRIPNIQMVAEVPGAKIYLLRDSSWSWQYIVVSDTGAVAISKY